MCTLTGGVAPTPVGLLIGRPFWLSLCLLFSKGLFTVPPWSLRTDSALSGVALPRSWIEHCTICHQRKVTKVNLVFVIRVLHFQQDCKCSGSQMFCHDPLQKPKKKIPSKSEQLIFIKHQLYHGSYWKHEQGLILLGKGWQAAFASIRAPRQPETMPAPNTFLKSSPAKVCSRKLTIELFASGRNCPNSESKSSWFLKSLATWV